METKVVAVSTQGQFQDFLQVPFHLHKDDLNWVPPLIQVTKDTISKKNPFFKLAIIQFWVAYKNSKPVGRISSIFNRAHNTFHKENVAFWGFFESENNTNTAQLLFQTAENWATSLKVDSIRGPMNPSSNYECGLQVSAFDSKPFVMMPQNPEYYPELIEGLGYRKMKDLHAWLIRADTARIDPDLRQMLEELEKTTPILIRNIRMQHYTKEITTLFEIYNDAWTHNWGFVPMEADEFFYAAKQLKTILNPKGVYILEIKGEPAAFCIGLPDINQITCHIRNGRLFPTGWLKLLWHLKIKKSLNQGRIITLGIKKKYQHLPLGAMLYNKFMQEIPKLGYSLGECSWILEDNRAMRSALRLVNATHYKTYRIYEKKLNLNLLNGYSMLKE